MGLLQLRAFQHLLKFAIFELFAYADLCMLYWRKVVVQLRHTVACTCTQYSVVSVGQY